MSKLPVVKKSKTFEADIETHPSDQLPNRFRYSRQRFYRDLLVSAAMTALISLLIWMMLVVLGNQHLTIYTTLSGLLFFVFLSARSLIRFLKNDVIMAVTPAGIMDLRIGHETIDWHQIRDIAVSPREQDTILRLTTWQVQHTNKQKKIVSHRLDISVLDRNADEILASISKYHPIRIDHALG